MHKHAGCHHRSAHADVATNRLLNGGPRDKGVADLARAIALVPDSPDVRYIVADAYTYGFSDPPRALAEATLAFDGGLDTPRVHAILGGAHNALGHVLEAAVHVDRHLELVTTELVTGGTASGSRRSKASAPETCS